MEKTQIRIVHQKEGIDWKKKFPKQPKKVRIETREFCTYFLLLTSPYGMFEIKKTQILIEFLDRTQKSTASRQKKVS